MTADTETWGELGPAMRALPDWGLAIRAASINRRRPAWRRTAEERQSRKRKLLKGPAEFHDLRR